jgi:transcriptional regulator with XRE-family HTH domain
MKKTITSKKKGPMTEAEVKELVRIRINEILKSKQVSMRTLSIQLGFSEGYINQIMNNDMMPSLSSIIMLCNSVNMSLSDFFNCEELLPLEYYEVSDKVKQLSVPRLEALSVLLNDVVQKTPPA